MATPRIQTYNPADVIVTFGGQALTGFGQEVVRVERVSPTFVDEAGADQEVVRVNQNDRRGIVTVTLIQSSPSNLYLTGLQLGDEASGAGILPLQVKDNGGNDLHSAPTAWIEGPPRVTYNKGVEQREWVFRTNDLRMFVGGSAQTV